VVYFVQVWFILFRRGSLCLVVVALFMCGLFCFSLVYLTSQSVDYVASNDRMFKNG
jgi:hypothetical protein